MGFLYYKLRQLGRAALAAWVAGLAVIAGRGSLSWLGWLVWLGWLRKVGLLGPYTGLIGKPQNHRGAQHPTDTVSNTGKSWVTLNVSCRESQKDNEW